jgi:hypothetical protein
MSRTIRWLTDSKFKVAMTTLIFFVVFTFSVINILEKERQEWGGSGQQHQQAHDQDQTASPLTYLSTVIGLFGTLSSVALAWRSDRRTARESDLKMTQLRQQIAELELEIKATQPGPAEPV